jgi:hypothetical protein
MPTSRCVPSLSFSGCGLHIFFQVGVAHALLEANVKCDLVCATSGGMASALYYLLDLRKHMDIETILKIVPCPEEDEGSRRGSKSRGREGKGGGSSGGRGALRVARRRMIRWLKRVLDTIPDAFTRVSGKLRVTLMEWPCCRSREFDTWTSNCDLLQCLRGASDIPFIDSSVGPTRWRGRHYYDGGILCSHPIVDKNTVCVTTSSFGQPWSKAWQVKRGWWGEICHPVETGSLNVFHRSFYHNLWDVGLRQGRAFVARRFSDPVHCSRKQRSSSGQQRHTKRRKPRPSQKTSSHRLHHTPRKALVATTCPDKSESLKLAKT